MRALLINPTEKSITSIETRGTWEDIRRIIECEWVQRIQISRTNFLWVDEEGLLHDPKPIFQLGTNRVMGNGLVLGETPNGESCDCAVPVPMLRKFVTFPDIKFLGLTTTQSDETGIMTISTQAVWSDQ